MDQISLFSHVSIVTGEKGLQFIRGLPGPDEVGTHNALRALLNTDDNEVSRSDC